MLIKILQSTKMFQPAAIITICILFGLSSSQPLMEGCEYDHNWRTYNCKNVTHLFPNQYYGSYHLRCVSCQISTFTKETFPYNNSLISFNASDSHIRHIKKNAFSKLIDAQFLYLDNNSLESVSEEAFSGLKMLYELHLERNNLRELKLDIFKGLGANVVDLSYNKIEILLNRNFYGTLNLLNLDLGHNFIHIVNKDAFLGLDYLEGLHLEHNKICNLPLGVFKNLWRLRSLDMSNNNLTTFAMGVFSGLKSLTHLNLANNSLHYFDGGQYFLPLLRLSSLDVSQNGIYYFDAYRLKENVPSLKQITIDNNLFSCKNIEEVARYFKKENIEVVSYAEKFDVQNIYGIACIDLVLNEPIPFDLFLKAAEEDAIKTQKFC